MTPARAGDSRSSAPRADIPCRRDLAAVPLLPPPSLLLTIQAAAAAEGAAIGPAEPSENTN